MNFRRITFVIPSLERGGAERVVSILANAWAKQGREITILTLNGGSAVVYPLHSSITLQNLGLPGERANSFPVKALRQIARVRALRSALRKSAPDVAISFLERANVLTLLAVRGLAFPVIVSERVDPRLHDIGPLWQLLRRITYKWADALVCQTSGSLSWFVRSIQVRGYVIPNPVEAPPESSDISQAENVRRSGHVIAAMGRLVEQKGFDLLLDAFARVAAVHEDWSLVIGGMGPLHPQLVSHARKYGLDERVYFLGEVSDPYAIYRAADVFVLSSRFEGFPNSLCEAMASGLAVVSFDCPSGPRDIIRHGIDGILVPPGDVTALASALDRMMSDEKERLRLASRAPEIVTRFSLHDVLLLWEQLFNQCTEHQVQHPS